MYTAPVSVTVEIINLPDTMPVKSKAIAVEKMEKEQTEGQVVFLTPGSCTGKGMRRAEKTENSLPVEVSLV